MVVHLFWSFASRIGSQVIQLAVVVILARLLTPSEFGIMAILAVFTGFAQIIADCGLGAALIHRVNPSQLDISTVFVIQLAIGIIIMLSFYFGAPAIAAFYDTPILANLTQLMSVIYLFQSIGQVHNTYLVINGHFKKLALISILSALIGGTIAIPLALENFGVWALVWQSVCAGVVSNILFFMNSKWRPTFAFSWRSAKDLGSYGIYLFMHGVINYWLRNADNLAIGKVLGSVELGLYNRAYSLMMLPLVNIGSIAGQVVFPALCREQSDIRRVKELYISAIGMTALIMFPLMSGMAILSTPFLNVVFGAQWIAAAPILSVLGFVGLFQSITFPATWIYNCLGKTYIEFYSSVFFLSVFIPAISIGLMFGTFGVACAYAIWAFFCGVISIYVSGRLIGLPFFTLITSTYSPALATVLMCIVVVTAENSVLSSFNDLIKLTGGILVGFLSYVVTCAIYKNDSVLLLERLVLAGISSSEFRNSGPRD